MKDEVGIAPAEPGSRARRFSGTGLWLTVSLILAVFSAVALGTWLCWPPSVPEPILPDLTGADREVAEAINAALDEVVRQRYSTAARGRLGEVLLAHEFYEEANACFQQAELLDSTEPAWPYLQGLCLLPGDPEPGIASLERSVQRGGRGLVGRQLVLAEVLLDQGRLRQGEDLLTQVLQADPSNLRARTALGRLALLRQNWRAGLEYLEACRSDVHTRKRAHSLCAEAWRQLGKMERARAEQRRAEELPQDQPWPDPFLDGLGKLRKGVRARILAANYLVDAGRSQAALELLGETTRIYPESLEAWTRMGLICAQANKLAAAEAAFQRAIDLRPDVPESWFLLGFVQFRKRSPQTAASLREAIRLKLDHAHAHFFLGEWLKQQGDRDAAAAEFREALRCRPDHELAASALRELEARK